MPIIQFILMESNFAPQRIDQSILTKAIALIRRIVGLVEM